MAKIVSQPEGFAGDGDSRMLPNSCGCPLVGIHFRDCNVALLARD